MATTTHLPHRRADTRVRTGAGVFKRSAEKLAAAVKAAKPGVSVVINEEKVRPSFCASFGTPPHALTHTPPLPPSTPQPRKGAFEVKVGDTAIVSLTVRHTARRTRPAPYTDPVLCCGHTTFGTHRTCSGRSPSCARWTLTSSRRTS